MGLIFDTGYFIKAERKGASDLARKSADGEETGISAVTYSELYVGVHRAASSARAEARALFFEHMLEGVAIIDFDREIALLHARVRAKLLAAGNMIGAHDLIIAATALHLGWAVKTANEGEFRRIEGLTVLSL